MIMYECEKKSWQAGKYHSYKQGRQDCSLGMIQIKAYHHEDYDE